MNTVEATEQAGDTLIRVGKVVGAVSMKPEVSDDQKRDYGIGAILGRNFQRFAIHPAHVGGLALEDLNYHDEAAALFSMAGTLRMLHEPRTVESMREDDTIGRTILENVAVPLETLAGCGDLVALVSAKICPVGRLVEPHIRVLGSNRYGVVLQVKSRRWDFDAGVERPIKSNETMSVAQFKSNRESERTVAIIVVKDGTGIMHMLPFSDTVETCSAETLGSDFGTEDDDDAYEKAYPYIEKQADLMGCHTDDIDVIYL